MIRSVLIGTTLIVLALTLGSCGKKETGNKSQGETVKVRIRFIPWSVLTDLIKRWRQLCSASHLVWLPWMQESAVTILPQTTPSGTTLRWAPLPCLWTEECLTWIKGF